MVLGCRLITVCPEESYALSLYLAREDDKEDFVLIECSRSKSKE